MYLYKSHTTPQPVQTNLQAKELAGVQVCFSSQPSNCVQEWLNTLGRSPEGVLTFWRAFSEHLLYEWRVAANPSFAESFSNLTQSTVALRYQRKCAPRGGGDHRTTGGPSIGSSHAERLPPYLLCWILWTDYTPSTFFPLPNGLRPHKTLPLYIGWICTSLILPVNRPSVIWTILIIFSLDYFKTSASATGRVNSP